MVLLGRTLIGLGGARGVNRRYIADTIPKESRYVPHVRLIVGITRDVCRSTPLFFLRMASVAATLLERILDMSLT